ncbi:GGDEF domain-containing protein [Sulfurimonas sp.]
MINLDDNEIKNLISIDTFNDTSLFAVSVVELPKYEVLYVNQAMKNIMSDMTAHNCWEAIHGQEAPCMWCKAPMLLANLKQNIHHSQSTMDNAYAVYEHFNEVANKWYQVQEKVITLEDSRDVLISFALDISLQKDAQSKLIDTHVKLTKQTKALEEAQKKLKEQANRDPLTNMHNRRYFSEISEKIISITKRSKDPLSLIMIDIDNFKKINDTYGHNVGDEVIKLLANELASTIRQSDVAARFGGEEFAIILPNTDATNAFIFADKLRENIENISYKDKKDTIKFTVSIGVDEFNHENDNNVSASLNRADKALYEAKTTGKNKVLIFKH